MHGVPQNGHMLLLCLCSPDCIGMADIQDCPLLEQSVKRNMNNVRMQYERFSHDGSHEPVVVCKTHVML